MPLTDFSTYPSPNYATLEFSEYIVRESDRVLPQYLVIYQ